MLFTDIHKNSASFDFLLCMYPIKKGQILAHVKKFLIKKLNFYSFDYSLEKTSIRQFCFQFYFLNISFEIK